MICEYCYVLYLLQRSARMLCSNSTNRCTVLHLVSQPAPSASCSHFFVVFIRLKLDERRTQPRLWSSFLFFLDELPLAHLMCTQNNNWYGFTTVQSAFPIHSVRDPISVGRVSATLCACVRVVYRVNN